MKKLNNEDNSRLMILVAFSMIFLTIWNNLFPSTQKNETSKIEINNTEDTKIVKNKNQININEAFILKNKKENNLERQINLKNFSFKTNIDNNKLLIYDILSKEKRNKTLTNEKDFISFGINTEKDYNINWNITKTSENKVTYKGETRDFIIEFNLKENSEHSIIINYNLKNISRKALDIVPYLYFKNTSKEFENAIMLKENSINRVKFSKLEKENTGNKLKWFGITSQYFSIIVKENEKDYNNIIKENEKIGYISNIKNIKDSYQDTIELFILPNSIEILSKYNNTIEKANKIVDFGFFSIIAKPILILMNKIYKYVENYAIAIIIVTIIFKIITIPLINKSYYSMKKMKELNPQIELIKEKYKNDATSLQKETMNIYRRNNINPLSTVIPILIQIPLFFALYKVFSNAFELYGSNGFLWIKDLSEPEGLSFLNLFGLLNFNLPNFLNIGPLSLVMGLTTYIQQKTTPSATGNSSVKTEMEKTQESVMNFMPIFLTFISSSFPSGLLIYWIVSNTISILHQIFFKKLTK